MGAKRFTLDSNDDFVDQRPEQFLPVARRGRGCVPQRSEVGTDREKAAAHLFGNRAPGLAFAPHEIGPRGFQRLQGLFPLALEAARHETVFRIDGAIAPLGALGFVARAFRREPPWLERGLAIRLEVARRRRWLR